MHSSCRLLQAALLRAYLLEHAEALWADRAARLEARGVAAAEVEEAERLWVLSALDGGWTRHIAAMAVLRNSCNLRAFGLLEPLEEYNVDGARAFDEFALAFRRAAVQSFFAFVDPIPADGGAADGEEP
jgi:preprotein translocase subunit SecA